MTTSTTLLIEELRAGSVAPERYSRRSLCSRRERLLATATAASVAILGSMLLCEMTVQRGR